MAEIGTLEYIISTKDETSSTIDGIARKIQEMSSSLAEAGNLTDEQMQRMAQDIQEAYAGLDTASATHRATLDSLQQTYNDLGQAAADAFKEGNQQSDIAYRKAMKQQYAVAAQIREEKKFGKEIDSTADELAKVADAFEEKAAKVSKAKDAEASLRQQIREVRDEMQRQLQAARDSGDANAEAALRASEGYQQLQQRLGSMRDTMGDVQTQMSILANDNAGLQGVIVGLQGMSGTMSAAQGIAGMFTKDQEALQQVMLKVQSTMAIANGMMQVANALNKDSYFTLTILNRVKEAYASISKEALAAQEAETAATQQDITSKAANKVATDAQTASENAGTAAKVRGLKGWITNRLATATDTKAKIANTIATKAASTASKGLAVSLRLVATAIKSIPVIGWILAGIAGLAGVIGALTKSSRDAKKEQEELNEKIQETASEPVAAISKLSSQYAAIGDNMQEKQKFIEKNKAEFDKLGISINSVADAEDVLINNKDKFVQAQIEKAKASVLYDTIKERAKELVDAEQEYQEDRSNKNAENVQEAEDAMTQTIAAMTQAEQKAEQLMGEYSNAAGQAQSEVAKKTADGSADSIASLNRLSQQWKSLGGDIKAQNKFIAENKGEFDKLGVGIRSAADAENVLVTNKDKFVQAMEAKAQSMAYFDLAKEKYKEYIAAQMEMDELLDGTSVANMTAEQQQRMHDLQSRMGNLRKEAEGLLTKGNDKANEANKTLRTNTSNTSATKEDPFIKNLTERKKEYERYTKFVRSTNETLQQAAQSDEFSALLEGGNTYKEYLENQIAILQQAGEKTAGYREHMAALMDELANLEKATVIDDFRKSLEDQLAAAQTTQQMLDIIAENRKKLQEGGDTEVNQEKSDILDQQQKDIETKDAERTQALLQQYSDYLQKRIEFETNYAEDSRRLNAAIANAKTEDERRIAENALRQLERQRQRYANGRTTGDTDYDAMLAEFQSYQEQKEAIEDEYREKIAIATAHDDKELADRLAKQRADRLSKLAKEKIVNSETWKQLFDNLDNLTIEAVENLIKQIEDERIEISSDIKPEDLEEIKKKLREAAAEISAKTPFTALKYAIQQFSDESSSANLNAVLSAGNNLAANFNSVTNSMREIGELTGNQDLVDAADLMDDIIGNFQAAEEGAEAWGGWWGAIIGGVIDLIPKVIKWVNKGDEDLKSINRTIEENENKIEGYQNAYSDLQKEVSRATGQALDEANRKLGENLRLQITQLETTVATLEQQISEANEKKVTDEMREQLADFKKQVEELKGDLQDLMDDIVERTLGNHTVNSIMEDLATVLVDAWAQGENAAEAYRDKVKDIVKDIARNMIIQNLITDEFTKMLTKYTDKWTENTSWEDKADDIERWYKEAMGYSDEMMAAMNGMSDKWREWLSMDTEASGLSGAIKGMSQESADLLAGVANAMRLNQAAIINSIGNILEQTRFITTNTGFSALYVGNIYSFLKNNINASTRTSRTLGIQNNE